MMTDDNLNRWVSKKKAATIVGLGYERTVRFLTDPAVRSREVPWGTSRRTHQYWLPDVLNISNGLKAG